MRVPPFSFRSAPYDVVLTTEPSDDVTVAAPPATGSDADSTANTSSLVFTPATGARRRSTAALKRLQQLLVEPL